MRQTIIKGKNHDLRIELGSDVGIICYIMEIGKCLDYLIYEVQMSGKELIAFLDEFKLAERYKNLIHEELDYIVTAYDW